MKLLRLLSPLILQKMKEDNYISQLGDYEAPLCELQYSVGFVISLCSNSNHLMSLIPPKLPQILDIYSVVALYSIDLLNSLLGLNK